MSFGKGSIVLENLRGGGDKREEGEAGREAEGGREEPGAVMGVIRKPDPPLGFKGNGISRQRVSISPGILHVRVPFEQKKKKKKILSRVHHGESAQRACTIKAPLHSTGRHAASAVAASHGFTNLLFSKDCRCVLFHFLSFRGELRVGEGGGDSSDRRSIIKRTRKSFPSILMSSLPLLLFGPLLPLLPSQGGGTRRAE